MKIVSSFTLILFVLILWTTIVHSVRPDDEIHLTNLGKVFWLKNETYQFDMVYQYSVPKSVKRHIIYTSSPAGVISTTKRAIMDNLSDLKDVAEEDYFALRRFMGDDMPTEIRLNKKKRALPLIDGGLRVIRLTDKVKVLMNEEPLGIKRAVSQIGTTTCLHIPFFTTCDNSADIKTVKAALNDSINSIYQEIDSYKKTDNARVNALTTVLNTQKSIIDSMATSIATISDLITVVSQSVQVNAAQMADGDFQAHSQISYLKRVTNSLMKYSNAMASSDPRAVVAQPALTQLFSGYLSAIKSLKTEGYEAIVDYKNNFTWNEVPLPASSVSNSTDSPCRTDGSCNYNPYYLSRVATVPVFTAVFKYTCKPTGVTYCSPANLSADATSNFIYGPFHKNHYGIYKVFGTTKPQQTMQPIVQTKTGTSIAMNYSPNFVQIYCAQFMGYKMFTSVRNPSVDLINSYSSLPPSTDCDAYRLVDGAGSPTLPSKIYSLYAETEGVIIPFYSNCDRDVLRTAIYAQNPGYGILNTINYVCSNLWTQSLKTPSPDVCGTVPMSIANSDVFRRHWITPTCYMNLEPGWIELDYWVQPNLVTIPFIPRGYRLNQFTINLEGELSSSIDFVYTDAWLKVYSLARVSQNTIIADEIAALDKTKVLFNLERSSVIDESDYLFGKGINGRDCIQKSIYQEESFDYNLLNCYFQNDNAFYSPNQYLNGIVTTTGISRYNKKFDFLLYDIANQYSFTLTPKSAADFSYSLNVDPNDCPTLVNQVSGVNQCIVTLFYSGSSAVSATPDNSSLSVINNITFLNKTAQFTIGTATYTFKVGTTDCFFLSCLQTSTVSYVTLTFPYVQIVSASDLALQSKIKLYIQDTITQTTDKMTNVQVQLQDVSQSIANLRTDLAALDFNVTQYPYRDFTYVRNQVQELISGLGTDNQNTGDQCDGPWNSAVCWFKDFAGALITFAVVAVITIIGYIVLVKTGVKDRICSKNDGDDDQIRMTTRADTF